MFRPRHFAEDDVAELVSMVRAASFGHLVVTGPEGLASTPVPFVIDDDGSSVRAHLARPNPVWRLAPCVALLIVPVTDTYVSPSWYPSKGEHGRVVPTWNYEIVHVHGRLVLHDDAAWIARQIRDLTDALESAFARPWAVDDAPRDHIERLQRVIVGIELTVSRLEGKRKLSQNRSDHDVAGAIAGLASSPRRGAQEVRRAMQHRAARIDDDGSAGAR